MHRFPRSSLIHTACALVLCACIDELNIPIDNSRTETSPKEQDAGGDAPARDAGTDTHKPGDGPNGQGTPPKAPPDETSAGSGAGAADAGPSGAGAMWPVVKLPRELGYRPSIFGAGDRAYVMLAETLREDPLSPAVVGNRDAEIWEIRDNGDARQVISGLGSGWLIAADQSGFHYVQDLDSDKTPKGRRAVFYFSRSNPIPIKLHETQASHFEVFEDVLYSVSASYDGTNDYTAQVFQAPARTAGEPSLVMTTPKESEYFVWYDFELAKPSGGDLVFYRGSNHTVTRFDPKSPTTFDYVVYGDIGPHILKERIEFANDVLYVAAGKAIWRRDPTAPGGFVRHADTDCVWTAADDGYLYFANDEGLQRVAQWPRNTVQTVAKGKDLCGRWSLKHGLAVGDNAVWVASEAGVQVIPLPSDAP